MLDRLLACLDKLLLMQSLVAQNLPCKIRCMAEILIGEKLRLMQESVLLLALLGEKELLRQYKPLMAKLLVLEA